ncbi:MAG: FecR domain-containing protein [Chloroflexota bacterium]|jgi:hypothetical protein
MIESHRFNRQWLAWIVLFGSFFVCFVLSITLPLSLRAYFQNATRPLDITVQANQGTVGIDEENGLRRAVLAGEDAQLITSVASIRTDTTASALMEVAPHNSSNPLARLQVSSNTSVQLNEASSPRFRGSPQVNRLEMDLESGRVRIDVPFGHDRPLLLHMTTPQGSVDISQPGRYMMEVSNDITQVTVQEQGTAKVSALDEVLTISPGQRAEIPVDGNPVGPLDPARNLVNNGDFNRGLDDWALFSWQMELLDQPKGETTVLTDSGDPLLRFSRQGIGHADVRVSQSMNQDVSDYEALRLQTSFQVMEQSLGVCGVQGSECPLFIIINYIDDSGISRIWQQGFFAEGTVDDNLTPGACISCAVVQRAHERVALGQLYFYDVDLRQELARQGSLPPRVIESIALVASGHSFVTEISDIALIAE